MNLEKEEGKEAEDEGHKDDADTPHRLVPTGFKVYYYSGIKNGIPGI